MSTDTILLFAIGVFVLMAIGIGLTMVEFNRIEAKEKQNKTKKKLNETAEAPRKDNLISAADTPSKGTLSVVGSGPSTSRNLQ